MQDISLIVAMTHQRVIGKEGRMPWTLLSDMKRFREITLGHPLIMGYTTFVSILEANKGKPLDRRPNIVVTRSHAAEVLHLNGIVATSPRAALRLALSKGAPFIIGGAQIYEKLLPNATKLYLTLVDGDITGDTYFPDELRLGDWKLDTNGNILSQLQDPADSHDSSFHIYTR